MFHTLETSLKEEGQLHGNCSVQLKTQTGVAAGECSRVGGEGCRDLRCDRSSPASLDLSLGGGWGEGLAVNEKYCSSD